VERIMPEYTCPECATVLRSKAPAPEGKKIRCKECGHAFVAVPAAEEPAKTKAQERHGNLEADTESYGVAESNEPEAAPVKYGEVEDKFKRSTRGPAMALMVLPTNLLIAQGALTFLSGIAVFMVGIFPLVFSEVEPSEEEWREGAGYMMFGVLVFCWGCLVCFGASQMQNLESYTWGWVGAVAGLPAGVFAAVMLRNPKVIAGFQENIGAIDDEDEADLKKDGDDDEDDDDDDDEDDDDD
jgi:predicted Zn finger-like uncharacterized protein